MRHLMWATVLVAVTVIGVSAQEVEIDARANRETDQAHARWIQHVMRSISTVKPGMTRKDLARILAEEGGLSTRSQRTYVYRHCSYIKVDVQFSPVDEATTESPNDKIVKISRPFLEYPIFD